MRKNICSIMLVLAMMFVAVACSKSPADESKSEEETKISKFESQVLEAILESEHVKGNLEEYRMDRVAGEITDKDRDGDEAEVKCELTYISKHAEMKEVLECELEKTDDGWVVVEVEEIEDIYYVFQAEVYFLNYRAELDDEWRDLAKEYTELTGINVKVLTAATGTYDVVLKSELGKEIVPTLFNVTGYHMLKEYKDICYDLSNTDVYGELTSEAYALKDGNSVLGLAYTLETYGLITNKKLLGEAGYSVDQIKSFEDLKNISEDIASRSEELGFTAFTSAGMGLSSDWRFKTHLANLPIYYEYQTDGIGYTSAIKGIYLDNYRAIFDLYINNSTCDGAVLEDMENSDSLNEFLNEEAVFYQNGSWTYGDLRNSGMSDDDITMIPIYFGVGDEASQGLCSGSENFWCVNKEASSEDIKATLDFLYWCVTSEYGTDSLANEMGFDIPYAKAVESNNFFIKIDAANTVSGLKPVTWTFDTIPSEYWKNNLGYALTEYAKDPTDENWDEVENNFVAGWATEYQLKN